MGPLSVAVVAGGASSRFGGIPKGLEMVGGRRIVDRVIDAARHVASEVFLISNSADAPMWTPDVRVVNDVRPERGSIVGIHTALATTNGPTLVVAWDMPFVSTPLLSLIADRDDDQYAVIPEGESGLEPFCALYMPACLPMVECALDENDLRATALPHRFPSFSRIARAEIERIGEPTRLFFNVNSADDLARAEEIEKALERSRPG